DPTRACPSESDHGCTDSGGGSAAPTGTSSAREIASGDAASASNRHTGKKSVGRLRRIGPMDARPIGVFDSGMGGLTVLHELLVTLPHEDFVYLGDAARLPYGPRPLPEIRRFAQEIGAWLEDQDVKLIVVACNAATS